MKNIRENDFVDPRSHLKRLFALALISSVHEKMTLEEVKLATKLVSKHISKTDLALMRKSLINCRGRE